MGKEVPGSAFDFGSAVHRAQIVDVRPLVEGLIASGKSDLGCPFFDVESIVRRTYWPERAPAKCGLGGITD